MFNFMQKDIVKAVFVETELQAFAELKSAGSVYQT